MIYILCMTFITICGCVSYVYCNNHGITMETKQTSFYDVWMFVYNLWSSDTTIIAIDDISWYKSPIMVIYTSGISCYKNCNTFGKMMNRYCKSKHFPHILLRTLWHHVLVSEKNGDIMNTCIICWQKWFIFNT